MSKNRAIILGAGRPHKGEQPASLSCANGQTRILDWAVDAFEKAVEVKDSAITFVGGYRIHDIMQQYPKFNYFVNSEWQQTGSAYSLLLASFEKEADYFVCYADIVFEKELLEKMHAIKSDIVIAVDTTWGNRYRINGSHGLEQKEKVKLAENDERVEMISRDLPSNEADGEFVGLLKVSADAIEKIMQLPREHFRTADISRVIMELKNQGCTIKFVESDGRWAELNEPQDLTRFILGTKGETLERLQTVVKKCKIDDQIRFTQDDWENKETHILREITSKWGNRQLIARSCAIDEDGWHNSCAGQYKTVMRIPGGREETIANAVETVFASYGMQKSENQVFVQEMLNEVVMSGVVMTRVLKTGAPYYVINYDDLSCSTDSVTSGQGKSLKTFIIQRDYYLSGKSEQENRFTFILDAVREIEELVYHDALDIEFLVDQEGAIHILQLRPITAINNYDIIPDLTINNAISGAEKLYRQKKQAFPHLVGEKSLFGVMPDWNPAEIIGVKPRILATSLYRYLIMDDIWAVQRAEFGYRDVRPSNLLTIFAGHPYVDVRACFNSYIPADISKELAEKMVNRYLDILRNNPHFHDKVEFDVVMTCYAFDFKEKARSHFPTANFSQKEIDTIQNSLVKITNNAFDVCNEQMKNIMELEQRYNQIEKSEIYPLEKAYLLLEECKKYGTLCFAHLARSAFIAMTLLKSLVQCQIISEEKKDLFLQSINTVAKVFSNDATKVKSGHMRWSSFVKKYGHLRPGTYEITSQPYHKNSDVYLKPIVENATNVNQEERFELFCGDKRKEVDSLLASQGMAISAIELESFFRKAIEGREYAKFIFTKNLSLALDEILNFAQMHGVSDEQISHIALKDIMEYRISSGTNSELFEELIKKAQAGESAYRITQAIELPPLINKETDFYFFEKPQCMPNYVTQKCVTSQLVVMDISNVQHYNVKDRIVIIPNADPGFDWLFSSGIAGLITMYGGVNSHMAIRAAEASMPAAIGVGEGMYEELKNGKLVELNCAMQKIKVIH